MPGLHAELPGRPECTGRLERLASQVLRTDRSEFRKERHTGCRTECWWLPGLGSERHTGLRWALPESAQALQVPERLPYTDQRLASEQPLRTGRRPVPECRSGRIVRLTCAVREHAEQRVFGNVGALKGLKEANPKLLIAVSGCMAQQKEIVEKFKKHYPFVDIVFGVNGIDTLPDILCEKLATRKRVLRMPAERGEIIEDMPIRRDSTFRAWLPIMYGCDNFCSYCIVPYVRGRERSRASADILREFRQLVAEGYKDITLLGQNVNSYGKGLPEDITFAALLRMLDAVPGDYRIRFMTSHPKDATRELIDTIANSAHISRHLHLPVQSGSNSILAQMNRKYTVEDYLSLIAYAKRRMPEMTYSSDIIVGFPGETEEDFCATETLIREVEYMQLFTFIYSKRTGTAAASMPDPTPHK